MIGRLRGQLAEASDEEALIDVGGVGYVVRCGARTLSRLPAIGAEVVLQVETQWSEAQGPRLYGFLAVEDKAAFVTLQSVQGVGPKAALAVLDVLSPGELAGAAARGDRALVARANGVGPKLAARIVAELKDKPLGGGLIDLPAAAPAPQATAAGDAVAALMGLGLAEMAARRAVDEALKIVGPDAGESVLIREALKASGR
jgi:holliday junction DNA helicase RuvA